MLRQMFAKNWHVIGIALFYFIGAPAQSSESAKWKVPSSVEEPLPHAFTYCGEALISKEVRLAAQNVGRGRRAFWNMLSHFMNQIGFQLPDNHIIQLLHLGCGSANEASVLGAFFTNGKFGSYPSENIRILGVDIDAREIDRAVKNNERPDFRSNGITFSLPKVYRFVVGDATNLASIDGIPDQADIIVMRHEQISADSGPSGAWHEMIKQALSRVSDNGILIATSYSDIEADMFLEAANRLGATVLVHARNPFALPLSDPNISTDRVVTILKK